MRCGCHLELARKNRRIEYWAGGKCTCATVGVGSPRGYLVGSQAVWLFRSALSFGPALRDPAWIPLAFLSRKGMLRAYYNITGLVETRGPPYWAPLLLRNMRAFGALFFLRLENQARPRRGLGTGIPYRKKQKAFEDQQQLINDDGEVR